MSGKQSKTAAAIDEVESVAEGLSERADMVREQVANLDEQVRHIVHNNPLACLVGAVATGYLVGRVMARR